MTLADKNKNMVANKQAICDSLIQLAKIDRDIVVLTSDSRGSSAMSEFARILPDQFVEVGIAEQNLVGIAAGLAASGKKPFVASYAAFLTMRSIEQIKLDVAYSDTNVKIIGISSGLSYGPLGMSHHALQDIAVIRSIPNIHVIIPADRHESSKMVKVLIEKPGPAYIRVGRNPVPDVYLSEEEVDFQIGKAVILKEGKDLTLIATGETVWIALKASTILKESGVECRVVNLHTIKPLDVDVIFESARETGRIITIEEHSIYGGLGSAVTEFLSQNIPVPVKIIGIPDEPAVAGKPGEIFNHYGLNPEIIARVGQEMCNNT